MRSLAVVIVASVALLASANQVSAANKDSRERAAKKACLSGDPAKGVAILADLYIDTNDINYLFNQGRCYEQNHLYEDAIGRFREYLLKGESLSPEKKADAQKRIDACQSYLPKKEIELRPPPQESQPVVAQPVVAQSVVAQPVVVAPPVTSAAPAEPPVAVVSQPAASVDKSAGSGLRIAGIVVGAVGVAALGSAVFLNLKANHMADDLDQPDNYSRTTDSTRKTYKTLGWIGYGAGGACMAGGLLMYVLGWRAGHASTSSVALVPHLAPDVMGASLGGTF